jgi:hypothetical protein
MGGLAGRKQCKSDALALHLAIHMLEPRLLVAYCVVKASANWNLL